MKIGKFVNLLKKTSFYGITFVEVSRDPLSGIILEASIPTLIARVSPQVLGKLKLTYPLILGSSRKYLLNLLEDEAFKMLQKWFLSNSSRLRPNLMITDDMESEEVPPSNDPEDQAYSVKEIEPFNLEGYKKSAV